MKWNRMVKIICDEGGNPIMVVFFNKEGEVKKVEHFKEEVI